MKCPECKKNLVFLKGRHHYTESGLDNIYLDGIDIADCGCGEKIVSISNIPRLHHIIGETLIIKPSLLTGKEIRFLRKDMGMTAKRLADYLGVTKETVSRWENDGRSQGKPLDRLIRLTYAGILEIPMKTQKTVVDEFPSILPRQGKSQKISVPFESWAVKKRDVCSTT